MKHKTKSVILEVIYFLFIVLFVYAAVSKLMDYSNFKRQIGESPILGDFTPILAWGVPALEIFIAGLLIIPKYKLWGLYASFCLMAVFTIYLTYIINAYEHKDIPCSCGGILSGLRWKNHIYFNLCFVLFGAIGILIKRKLNKHQDLHHSLA